MITRLRPFLQLRQARLPGVSRTIVHLHSTNNSNPSAPILSQHHELIPTYHHEIVHDPWLSVTNEELLAKADACPPSFLPGESITPPDNTPDESVEAYIAMRERDRHLLDLLSGPSVVHIARKAAREHLYGVLDYLAEDVMAVYHRSSQERKAAILTLLKIAAVHPHAFQRARIIELYRALPKFIGRGTLHVSILASVARCLLSLEPCQVADYASSIESIIPLLARHSHSETKPLAKPKNGPKDARPPDPPEDNYIWLSFRLMLSMLQHSDIRRAFLAFEGLVREGIVPVDAVHALDHSTGDVKLITISALVRSCLQFGWWVGASRLLESAVGSDEASWKHISGLTTELLRAFLLSETPIDTENCGDAILRLISADKDVVVPDSLILSFYELAFQCGKGKIAESVYSHLQAAGMRTKHQYPLPKGTALTWLMEFSAKQSVNVHVARLLAMHATDPQEALMPSIRPQFISLCAVKGFSQPAKTLWERYSEGRDADMVVGHARMMLRLVSLFSSLGRPAKAENTKSGETLDLPTQSPMQDELAKRHVGYTVEEPRNFSVFQAEDIAPDTAIDNSCLVENRQNVKKVDPDFVLEPKNISSDSQREPFIDALESIDLMSSGHEDRGGVDPDRSYDSPHMDFARRVLLAFRQNKEPLEKASHMDLNALARGYTMVGNYAGCLEALKAILARREVPDLFDINVILSAVAQQSPRRAARMIEQMHEKGIRPDGVSFATVLNEALKQDDHELVGHILLKARSLGYGDLTDKAIVSLLRATLSCSNHGPGPRPAEGETRRNYLFRAYRLITELPRSAVIQTPNMGEDCIVASLRANHPEMAYEFWKLLVKGKTEWGYRRQVDLRRMIVDKIRIQSRRGRLNAITGRRMLTELGARTDSL